MRLNIAYPFVLIFALFLISCSALSPISSSPEPVSAEEKQSMSPFQAMASKVTVPTVEVSDLTQNLQDIPAIIKTKLEKFEAFVWYADIVLLCLVGLLGFGIIYLDWNKHTRESRHKKILTRVKKELQDISKKQKKKKIVLNISVSELAAITKDFRVSLPSELEDRLRDYFLSPKKIQQLEQQVQKSGNKWKKIDAITCLGYVRTNSTVSLLAKLLKDKDDEIAYSALLALGRIKNEESAQVLIQALGRDRFSGQKIVTLLENFPASIVNDVLRATAHPDASVRFWALKLLSKFKPASDWQKIAVLTEDASPNVRAAACECLGSLGRAEAKSVLLKSLRDQTWFVRMQAVRALSKISGDEAMPHLIQLMIYDSSIFVKESAKNALIKDIEKALPHIEQCLTGDDLEAKKYCVDALVDSNYISEILADILSPQPDVRKRAERLLRGLVKSQYYFGLKKTLDAFKAVSRSKILDVLTEMDHNLVRKMTL